MAVDLPINQPWFEWIVKGSKTTEGRSGPVGAWEDIPGVLLKCGSEEVYAKVLSVHHYPDLESYLVGELGKVSKPEHRLDDARQLYLKVLDEEGKPVFAPERVARKGGINALRLKVFNSER